MRTEIIVLIAVVVVFVVALLFTERRSTCSVSSGKKPPVRCPVTGKTSDNGVCPSTGNRHTEVRCPVTGKTSDNGVCPSTGATSAKQFGKLPFVVPFKKNRNDERLRNWQKKEETIHHQQLRKINSEIPRVVTALDESVAGGWVSRLGRYMSEHLPQIMTNPIAYLPNRRTFRAKTQRFLAKSGTYHLGQSHFDDGTFRIKTPGTYCLKEDILFNPPTGVNSTRTDTPLNGFWFSVLTTEADNVIIDGKGHTIEVDIEFMQSVNVIGSFVGILLGNNQFSGAIFGGGGATFPDTSTYVPANGVRIKNLKFVGRGTHFGIMANNSNDISISCCEISDCQVSNIYLQSVQGFKMRKTKLSGSVTPLTVNQDVTQLFYIRQRLQEFIDAEVPDAASQLADLEAYVSANPERFNPAPLAYPSTALYGLFVVPSPTTFFEYPVGELESAIGSMIVGDSYRNGGYNKDIVVENCQFLDFITEFSEMVGIGTNGNEPSSPVLPFQGWILLTFGLFGAIQWKDAFDSTGTFNPNDFLKSLVFIMNTVWPMLGGLQAIYPTNSATIFESILNNDANTFYANAAPLNSLQSDGTFAKGLFGIRAIAVDGASFKNLKFDNISAIGPPPIDPTTLPGYANVAVPQPLVRARANDAWHVSLEFCNNVIASDLEMKNLYSKHGYTFAYHFAGENSNCAITFSKTENQSAPNTYVNSVTDTGDAFGFTSEDNTGIIAFGNLETENIIAAGTVTHFATPSNVHPTEIMVANCVAN